MSQGRRSSVEDRQRRLKAFRRRSKAAEAGIHLPTYHELLRGSPFMGGDLRQDAQAFAERLLARIVPDTPVGKIAYEKTKALTLLPLSVDFRAASNAFQDYAEHSKAQEDYLECARRCELYGAAAGSSDSAFATAKWAMRLGNDSLVPSEQAYDFALAGIGWMIMANEYLPAWAINDGAPAFAIRLGGHLLDKLVHERSHLEAESKQTPAADQLAVPVVESGIDAAFETQNDNSEPLSVVVLKELGNSDVGSGKAVAREFEGLLGKRLPLVPLPDLVEVHKTLTAEFPHAVQIANAIIDSLVTQPYVKLKPLVLVGSPGCGKTTFASRTLQLLGVPSERYPCGGVSDSSLAGTARRWSTGEPSLPLSLVRRHMCASPGVVLDEIEKVGTSNYNGSLLDALLSLLERETAENWFDPYIQASVNLANVVWISTANSLDGLSLPLRDRCRVLPFPDPEPDHLQVLANRLLKHIVSGHGLDERWALPLDGVELEGLGRVWRGGSLRRLERLVEAVFKVRNMATVLH